MVIGCISFSSEAYRPFCHLREPPATWLNHIMATRAPLCLLFWKYINPNYFKHFTTKWDWYFYVHNQTKCAYGHTQTHTLGEGEAGREREKQKRFCALFHISFTPLTHLYRRVFQDRSSFHSYEPHRPNFNGEIEKRQSFISKDNSTLYTVYC